MDRDLLKEAKMMEADLTAWRRTLHAMPELGLELPGTSAFIQEKLKEMGIDYKVIVNGSCVVALLGEGDTCFLLRSDMDALPFKEESGETFASVNGCMHACGHDLHATILLGAAKLLKAHEKELKGQVKLLFQPGEETFCGAKAAIEEGVMDNPMVAGAFAMHVASRVPAGVVVYGPDPMAAVYGFKITIAGRGGHGSAPENCIDPINAGVHIYLALQELIARECPAMSETALTIGQFEAGSASNVIPDTAVLQGTMRSFDRKTAAHLVERLNEIVPAVARTYRAEASVEVLCDLPSVHCDETLNEEIVDTIRSVAPELHVAKAYHVMGSEDFAFISERVPASYMGLGAGVEDESKRYVEHNPRVRFRESVLADGAAVYAGAAMEWLERHGSVEDK